MHFNTVLPAHWQKPVFISLGAILLVLVVFLFFMYRSLPGSPLYGFKVNVYEEATELLRVTASGEASYHITLLERRFHEIERLADREGLDEGDLRYHAKEIQERNRELSDLLAAETGAGLTQEEAIMFTIRAGAVLEATERTIEEHERLLPIEEDIEDYRRTTVNRVDDLAEAFVVHGEIAKVQKFLNETLADISEASTRSNVAEDVSDEVSDDLRDAQSEMTDGDIPKGIEYIGDALRHILVAEYLGNTATEKDATADEGVDVTGDRQIMESPQVELRSTEVETNSE